MHRKQGGVAASGENDESSDSDESPKSICLHRSAPSCVRAVDPLTVPPCYDDGEERRAAGGSCVAATSDCRIINKRAGKRRPGGDEQASCMTISIRFGAPSLPPACIPCKGRVASDSSRWAVAGQSEGRDCAPAGRLSSLCWARVSALCFGY